MDRWLTNQAGRSRALGCDETSSPSAGGHHRRSQLHSMNTEVILRRFEQPDETREVMLGRFDIVRIGGLTIARDVSARLAVAETIGMTKRVE